MSSDLNVSVVLGAKNRRKLLQVAIDSVRRASRNLRLEVIVVDGGSTDGTIEWLANQRDVTTISQPNRRMVDSTGRMRLQHSWGEFINLGFKRAAAPWVAMISDDLVLCPNALEYGLEDLSALRDEGKPVGGGAMYWRDFPRDSKYHVKRFGHEYVHINHGIYSKAALETVGYADEHGFEFYGADGDLTMRLNLAGFRTYPLARSYAEHLAHRAKWRRVLSNTSAPYDHDMQEFERRYAAHNVTPNVLRKSWRDRSNAGRVFWRTAPLNCIEAILRRTIGR